MLFIDLFGLLHHTRVDRKGISTKAVLSAAHVAEKLED